MNTEKIEKIEALTFDLVNEVFDENKGMANFPLNLNLILEKAGISFNYAQFKQEDIDGIFNRAEKAIYVKEHLPYARKAFTVAHEIGHFYLHEEKEEEVFYRRDSFNIDDAAKEPEKEANWFAAALLMPRTYVKNFYEYYRDVELTAKAFGVSAMAAYWRLKNLGLVA